MALPFITVPIGLPEFLAAGHAIEESELFAPVKSATGHRRLRRIRTVPERTVNVSWVLSVAQMAALDDWFENALRAGNEFFSARVPDQDSPLLLWWKAKWLTPYRADVITGGYWRVSGQLRLFETGSSTAPVSSALASAFSVPLVGTAVITVPQFLVTSFTVALTSLQTLGAVNFGAALLVKAQPGDLRSRAFFLPGDLPSAAPGGSAALSISFMG